MIRIILAIIALIALAYPAVARNLGHGYPVPGPVVLTDKWQCIAVSGPALPAWYRLIGEEELKSLGYCEARQKLAATDSYDRAIPWNVRNAVRHGRLVQDFSADYCIYGQMTFVYEGLQKVYCRPGDRLYVSPNGPCRKEVYRRLGWEETWWWTLGCYYPGCGNKYPVWIPHCKRERLPAPPSVAVGELIPPAPTPSQVNVGATSANVSVTVNSSGRVSSNAEGTAGQATIQSFGGPTATVGFVPNVVNNVSQSQAQAATASQSQGQGQSQAQSQSQSQSQAQSQAQAQGQQQGGPAGQAGGPPSGS